MLFDEKSNWHGEFAQRARSLQRPLEGIRVIEKVAASAPLHVRLAVAMAGKIACELGAEVVLFEPDGGDPLRKLPPFLKAGEQRSALFEFLSGAKHVIPAQDQFNLGQHATHSVLLADASLSVPPDTTAVLVSSFGPRQTNLCDPASELTIMAMSGVLHLIGEQAGEPFRLPGHQPAYAAGLAAFLAMTAGLLAPSPKIADVCLLDALLWVNWKVVSEPLLKTPPGQAVNEWQIVEAADGHVALVYMDRDWLALADLVGDARLREARFATRPSRLVHLDELMAILRPWFAARGKADIYREAKRRGLPLGPVWATSDLVRDAQYLERDFWATTAAGIMPRLPVMWNGTRPAASCLARERR